MIKLAILITVLFLIGSTIILTYKYKKSRNYNEKLTQEHNSKISFKESMDLVDLPIITFMNNGKKLNFLLDTGSTSSHINEKALSGLDFGIISDVSSEFVGAEGNITKVNAIGMQMTYKDMVFTSLFYRTDLDKAFNYVKKNSGVQIHGLLGSVFFKQYGYVLDFKELKAYIKK